jgi:ABC-type nitrate/sulfonate/bicarbonate transport system substrate-binding protein/outer membrane protein OmpA-like peptidoglycan-associated protein
VTFALFHQRNGHASISCLFLGASLVGFVLRLWLFSLLFVAGCGGSAPPVDDVDGPATTTTQPAPAPATAQQPRALTAGKPLKGNALRVPFILWGGDMATFYGNGGLRTTEGSIFAKQGLILDLVPGDDFEKQIADYKSGASPFLRGTFRMIGLAAEQLSADPSMKPLVFMQMTWSAGDHLVARESVKTLDDLKGKTIVIQKGGPHIGMLDDVLKTAHLSWKDINVVWADSITGEGSPPELFRANPKYDAAFAITPDMLGLTGGVESVGSGAEGTVKGARVAVSTAELSRSIADVYAVRSDYWEANKAEVTKFTAGYLQAVEAVIDLKKDYETKGSDTYMDLLQVSQNIWGKDVIPTLEEDAHGLLSDCTFVGHPGNVAFFNDPKNDHGFTDFNLRSQDLAVSEGYAKTRAEVLPSPIDWESPTIKASLSKTDASRGDRFKAEAVLSEIEGMDADGVLDSRTLISFTIDFQPNQTEFDARVYSEEYKRVFSLADRYGNAAIVIRGHSDTTLVLRDAVKAGLENGKLKRSGNKGEYKYYLDGRPLNLADPKAMAEAIRGSDAFRPSGEYDPRKTMQAALNLSRERANAVRASLIQYAKTNGVRIDESQIQTQGVGIREPLIGRPRNPEEAGENMRVEFRLVRVSAEAIVQSDFDF